MGTCIDCSGSVARESSREQSAGEKKSRRDLCSGEGRKLDGRGLQAVHDIWMRHMRLVTLRCSIITMQWAVVWCDES